MRIIVNNFLLLNGFLLVLILFIFLVYGAVR